MPTITDRLYDALPVPVQNFGIGLFGLKYRHERLMGDFQKHVSGFRERQQWGRGQMDDYVAEQLQSTLLRAFTHVPYYQRAWSALGLTASDLKRITPETLHQLPLTFKSDLRADWKQFVAQDISRKTLKHYRTSGTTGTPIETVCTADGHRRFIAAREARSFNWASCTIEEPRSMIGGRLIVPKASGTPPYYRYNWAERQVYFSAYHIRPSTVSDYLAGFHKYRPKFMTGYAFSHYLLASLLEAQGLQLDYEPRGLVLSSERLTPEMKERIAKVFHARAFEEYGGVEQVALATECERGSLHVNPDFGQVELLDNNGNPVPPGTEGRVVATSLLNVAQPLIRYDTGDLAIWSNFDCPCGRKALPVVKQIIGRIEDSVMLPDGSELVRFHGVFIGLPHVMAGQIIQESLTSIRVRVVATDGFGAKEEDLIRHRIQVERLGDVTVTVEKVSDLERTAYGKIRGVISLVPESERRVVRRRAAAV